MENVRMLLQAFQAGYSARDLNKVDEFMDLFHSSDRIELIGISAAERGGREWFVGRKAVREIILSDWEFWGEVNFDIGDAQINIKDQVAWVTMTGKLIQTGTHEAAMSQYLDQMKALLRGDSEDPEEDMLEAVHFGIRRLWERAKGPGFAWPFVLTAVLLKEDGVWRFHTIHWSMPVD
jgi:hypothetical protein